MKKTLLTLLFAATSYCGFSQAQIITTGNNVIDSSNPLAADIVIGSNWSTGIRHDASIMWWSNASADRISVSGDIFYFSPWLSTTPNIGLSAFSGATSYFKVICSSVKPYKSIRHISWMLMVRPGPKKW
jgi:hypothetical protein